jgi:AraC family transcriptional regulator of adaptative response/methylated-DNA-[protein]-cysteine methyltransferase
MNTYFPMLQQGQVTMNKALKNNEHNNEFLYTVIAETIENIIENTQANNPALSLDELASQAGYSTSYFQKIFSSLTGVSPSDFQRFLKLNKASHFLLNGYNTLDSAYNAGLSGNGRLHDLYIDMEAVTPGQYAAKGAGLTIKHGTISTPIGKLCVGLSKKGLCWAAFAVNGSDDKALSAMKNFWKNAAFKKAETNELKQLSEQLENLWKATCNSPEQNAKQSLTKNPIKLYVEGTNFQIKVWQALLKIPTGGNVDYACLGNHINKTNSGRAIGNAVGANPISWIIPCHRVIKKGGIIHNYAWQPERKKSLLCLEQRPDTNNPLPCNQ